jgi:hypothetical protein
MMVRFTIAYSVLHKPHVQMEYPALRILGTPAEPTIKFSASGVELSVIEEDIQKRQ